MNAELAGLRASLSAELRAADRHDLAAHLDDLRVDTRDAVRVVVCGETKRGKSTLVNSLVGRPLLSPVGDDVTTACWVELRYGDHDEAHAVLADPHSLGAPRRVPIDIREVERYAAVREVADPVLGVEVRVRSPLLRDIVLVDTPGVGGLHAGHARTTLAALRQADVLLFVCDATQPILAPEVTFLREATLRVPAVLIAATKTDVNPDFDVVIAETRTRLASEPTLRSVPVFPLAAPLAHKAADVENQRVAARLAELSGIGALIASIRWQAAAGDGLRLANAATAIGNVARTFAAHVTRAVEEISDDREPELRDRIDTLSGLLDDQSQLTVMVRHDFTRLRSEPLDSFATAVAALGAKYRIEAERGPAMQLTTLAPRMLADLTARGITTLESVTEQATGLVRQLLVKLDIEETVLRPSESWDLDVDLPALTRQSRLRDGITHTSEVFDNLTRVVTGAATVITVLSGAGVVAACLALAAGIGWWRVRGDDERQRRAELGAWVDSAVKDASARLDAELRRRLADAERYVDGVLPALVAGKRAELRRLWTELSELRAAGERVRREAIASRRLLADRLTSIATQADVLAANATVPDVRYASSASSTKGRE
jgi:GTPase SAR1 family protein